MMDRSPQGGWMRKAGRALVFLVFFLLFDRLFFFALREWAFHFYGGRFAAESALKNSRQYEKYQGLILGTSRTQRAFDARAIGRGLGKRVRSKAGPGKFPSCNYLFFRQLQAHWHELQFVIYGVDYFMFAHRSTPAKMARLRRVSRRNALNPVDEENPQAAALCFSLLLHAKPGIDGFMNDWLSRSRTAAAGPGAEEQEEMGQERAEPSMPALTRRPAGNFKKRAYRRFPGQEGGDLLNLLGELSRRNIITFLVVLPDHIGTNATNHEQAAFKSDIRALAKRFPSVHFLDFNTPDRFRLDDATMFSDGGWGWSNSHLSQAGRSRFSREVTLAIKPFLPEP